MTIYLFYKRNMIHLFNYLFIYLFIIQTDLEIMVERATWWVLPGLLRNSTDMSGYLCDMSPS